jgi:hypothetical protein
MNHKIAIVLPGAGIVVILIILVCSFINAAILMSDTGTDDRCHSHRFGGSSLTRLEPLSQ